MLINSFIDSQKIRHTVMLTPTDMTHYLMKTHDPKQELIFLNFVKMDDLTTMNIQIGNGTRASYCIRISLKM